MLPFVDYLTILTLIASISILTNYAYQSYPYVYVSGIMFLCISVIHMVKRDQIEHLQVL